MPENISVIICCYNSSSRITNTLQSILQQIPKLSFDVEVIVVDNNSNDDTAEKVGQLFKQYPETSTKLVSEQTPGLSHARHAGINATSHPTLCFVDDDNEILEGYFELVANMFSIHPNLGILGGHGLPAKDLNAPTWFSSVQENFAVGPQSPEPNKLVKVDAVYGAGFSIRKRILDQLKDAGFASILTGRKGKKLSSGEDTELCWAVKMAGFDIGYHSHLKFIHHIPVERVNWSYVKKLNFGFGQSKVIIDIYQNVFQNTIPKLNSKLPYWFDRYLYLRKANKHFNKVNSTKDEPGNLDQLRHLGQKGEMKKLIELRSSIPKLYAQVEQFYATIKQNPGDK
ncbi:unnamed protein product [Chrysoparadoxa australica]